MRSPSGLENCLSEVDTAPLDDRIPLILIHGWEPAFVPGGPSPQAWDNFLTYYASSSSTAVALRAAFKPYLFSYYSNDIRVFDLAADLRDVLDQLNRHDVAFGSKPLMIVAHSMGGLIARSFIAQHWQTQGPFAGLPGGGRVLKLITLATPHHGSPFANGLARDAAAGLAWGSELYFFDQAFFSTVGDPYNLVNRTDLHWDNYDNFLNYSFFSWESNPWLANELNGSTTWDSKIIAYGGTLQPVFSTDGCNLGLYCVGNAILAGALSAGDANDGIVPLSSAVFYDTAKQPRALWRTMAGYNHSDMHDGKGDDVLFGRIATDLLRPWTLLEAKLRANPASGAAPLQTALTAVVSSPGIGTVNYTFWWDCPHPVTSVQQAIQLCGDPNDPAIGFKADNRSELSITPTTTYHAAGNYAPLVVVERDNSAIATTTSIVVSGASTCSSFTISPSASSTTPSSGSQQVAVVGSPGGCQGGPWAASGNGSWLTVSPSTGAGSGTVAVSWSANTSTTSRSANATIAGHVFAATQAGTAAAPPGAPFLLYPGAAVLPGTTTALLSPPFGWLAVAGADAYQVEVSDSFGTYPVQTLPAPQTTTLLQSPLPDNRAYKWRMRSHGPPGWGAFGGYYYFSTYTAYATGDFSIYPIPPSIAVSAGGSVASVVTTATTQGSVQTLTLSPGSLPSGISATLLPASISSGAQATLTLNVAAGTAPGAYTVAVSATSSLGVSHSTTVGLTVNPVSPAGAPAVCVTPTSLGFSDQQVSTSSSTQLVTLRNCGSGPLHVATIGASPEFFIGPGSIVPPLDLPAGTATTFQVGFAPLASGSRTGAVKVFSSAAGSPTILPLSGNATAAPSSTGTVSVQATLNGQPFTGTMGFSVTGPGGTIDFGNVPLTWPNQGPGSYTVAFTTGAPGGGTLNVISPSNTQTLTAGGAAAFIFSFSAANDFGFSCPTASTTGMTALMTTGVGGGASVPLTAAYILGGTQTIALAVAGLPAGATASFSPQSLTLSGPTASSTFSVSTSSSTPVGVYQLTFSATNGDGTTRTLTGILAVVKGTNPTLVSVGAGSVPSNGSSDLPAMSADGRYVAFFSVASNLVTGDTNGNGDIFLRDRQTGSTSRVSLADDGSQADAGSFQPSLSADGRFVAFSSASGNLVPGGSGGVTEVYVRDRQLGRTTKASVSSTGGQADGNALTPSLSGDGRFIAFTSNSTNLVAGGGGVTQIYVRDMVLAQTLLASATDDGSPGDGASTNPSISGDGRYVAFVSVSSNFVPGATTVGRQVFVRDLQAGTTRLVSGPPGGGAPNGIAYLDTQERLAISPDGRYIAFTSFASNLVPNDTNATADVFVWDSVTNATTEASVTSDGAFLTGGGAAPAISADGRFVAFRLYFGGATPSQIAVRDMAAKQTVIYSIGAGSVLGLAGSGSTSMSSDGRTIALSSNASNLVSGDTNGLQDIFAVGLPVSGAVFAKILAVSPTALSGGGIATGTISLSGAAPSGGVSVSLYSPASEVQLPGVVLVPAGATTSSFAIPTLPVAGPRQVPITASAGGGSPSATLALASPGPGTIQVAGGDGQIVSAGATLPVALTARVLDTVMNPVPGVAVQFSAPPSGASGAFAGGASSVLEITDASGIATAPVFTTNHVLGQYAVVAAAAGISSPALFTVVNGGLDFYSLSPCRILDTRNATGSYGGPALSAGSERDFVIAGQCGIPISAKAVSLNVTVTAPSTGGYLRLYPVGIGLPGTSTISYAASSTRANNTVLGLGAAGDLAVHCDQASGTAQLVIDVTGYFQ